MLNSELRDELVRQVEHAQLSALHRALDRAWLEGYKAADPEINSDLVTQIRLYARTLMNTSTYMARRIGKDLEKILNPGAEQE